MSPLYPLILGAIGIIKGDLYSKTCHLLGHLRHLFFE